MSVLEQIFQLDRALLLKINGAHGPMLDTLMSLASERLTWVPVYLVLLFLIWRRQGWPAFGWTLLAIVVMVALTDIGSVHLFKERFLRPRPCHVPELAGLLHLVDGRCGGAYGFISSHAANHFAIAVLAGLQLGHRKWLMPLLLLWAGLVSISRVYLGVHYPTDVSVGALYGILVALLCTWLLARMHLRSNLRP